MSHQLLIVGPDGQATEFPLKEGTLKVGRGQNNDLVIVGRGVSRHHAELVVSGGSVQVEDKDSTYGTKINGRQIRKGSVEVGDHIDIGVFRLILTPRRRQTVPPGQARPTRPPPSDGPETTIPVDREDPTEIFNTDVFEVSRARVQAPAPRRMPPMGGFLPATTEPLGGLAPPAVQFVSGKSDVPRGVVRIVDSQSGLRTDRVLERLVRNLAAQKETGVSADEVTSLVMVFRAAELMSRAANLGDFLDQVLDLLAGQLSLATAVLVRPSQVGRLEAVRVVHRDPIRRGRLPISRTVIDRALETRKPVLSADLTSDPSFGHRDSVMNLQVGALLTVPLLTGDAPIGVLYMSREAGEAFTEPEIALVLGVGSLIAKAVELHDMETSSQEQRRRFENLERLHSAEVVEKLCKLPDPGTHLTPVTATVLHVSVDPFDAIIRELGSERTAEVAVALRSLIHEAVFDNGGILVWLHERSGLAVFGAQSASESDAAWAVNAALEMLREYRILTKAMDLPEEAGLRVGLDRGRILLGFLGPSDRLCYTAIGEPVIRCARVAEAGRGNAVRATPKTLAQIPQPRGKVSRVASSDPALTGDLIEITL